MNHVFALGLIVAWMAMLLGCWLGWLLLRQNGRILLRLEALEKRLEQSENGDENETAMLPIGSPAPHFELHDLAGDRKTLSDFLDLVVQSADILWVWVTVLMWIPGLASILFRFVFREGFADVGWRVGRIRFFQKRNPAGARRSKMKIVSVAVSGVGVSVCRCEIETLEEVSPFPRCAEAQLDTSRPQC